jgi:mono/diheme cytochrome c family protein
VQELKVEGTEAQIERGRHLAAAFCVQCHSTTGEFPMTGGVDVGKDLPVNVGSFVSVNLTPAGPLRDWSDGEIFRAIRDNVDRDGKRLLLMAGTNVRYISDEDIHSLIAFLRSQEPVEKPSATPADRPNLLGMLMTGANLIPDPPLVEGVVSAPPKAPTAEYGKFMVSFLDCTACHGTDLSGGTSPVSPKGPSLRAVKGWTQEQFIAAFRTGRTPAGEELKPPMPWKTTGKLDDVELSALHEYLISLP